MSFPKRVRLRKRGQFMKTQREGVRLKGASFFAYARFTRAPQVRLGLTASKKVGKAHERNRYKRLAREAFRRSVLRHMSGVDLVVIIRQESPPRALLPLIDEFNRLAEQIKARQSKLTPKSTPKRKSSKPRSKSSSKGSSKDRSETLSKKDLAPASSASSPSPSSGGAHV
jgi:ribonuclease P protein component